jgi:hypothetical protein
MARVAATHVHVHKKNGESVVIAAGEEIPAWAVKLIDNPAVFAKDAAADAETGDSVEPGPYDGKSDDELRAILAERELPQDGDTAALLERLTQADADQE